MKRILVIGMTSTPGGVESFLVNYCLRIASDNLKFDFLCSSEKKIAYADRILDKCEIFYITPKRKNWIKHKKELLSFWKMHKGEYDILWANFNSLMNVDYLIYAKKYGINNIIVHSHNSNNMGGCVQYFFHKVNKFRIGKIANIFWACSEDAARWFYPSKILPEVKIIPNAIDVDKYMYDEKKRKVFRENYELSGCKVVGNIGRLHFQKNQKFLIKILSKMIEEDSNIKLLLIGDGPDEAELKEEVKKLGIEQNVIFLGVQKDICGWISAFDVFVFPSKFEGLSIVALEAQANGIPIVASTEAINSNGMINSNIKIVSLNNSIQVWEKAIYESFNSSRIPYDELKMHFKEKNLDINDEMVKMTQLLEKI